MDINDFFRNAEKKYLFSRQTKIYGEVMAEKLYTLKIMIIGLECLGVETAKNLILSGVEKVYLFDPEKVKLNDIGSNYFINENNIGKDRKDDSCLKNLKELNDLTTVKVLNEYNDISELIKNILNLNIDIIIITKILSLNNLIEINSICRNNNIKFIYSLIFGLYSFIFSDFGKEYCFYKNLNNKNNEKYICKSITNEKNPLVVIENDNNITLKDKDYVIFKNCKGMEEINKIMPKKIKYNGNNSFNVNDLDTTNFGKFIEKGIIYKLKNYKKLEFKSLEESIKFAFQIDDLYNLKGFCEEYEKKLGRNLFIFIIYYFIQNYFSKENKLPKLNEKMDSKDILLQCKELYNQTIQKIFDNDNLNEDYQNFDEEEVINMINWTEIQLTPICSIIGGFLSQEAIKAIGLYSPIYQWKFFDFYDCNIISKVNNLNNFGINEYENKYGNQIKIFGNDVQKKLGNLNIFLIGSGAIGCEVLKNLAMMGVSCSKNSMVTVTDDDIVELSNLNRQFLFQNKDIKKYKSKIACINIKKINKDFNCVDYQKKVCEKEDYFFNYEFWAKQDLIILAVDNVETRKYVNSKCVQYEKIFINSGTLGTEGKTEIIIPNKTSDLKINYKNNNEDNIIPMCALHGIPKNMDHCLEWSKDLFNNFFGIYINELNKFFNEKNVSLFYEDTTTEQKNIKFFIYNLFCNLIINKEKIDFEQELINSSKYLIYFYFIKNMEFSIDTTFENGKFKNKMVHQFIISFIYIISKIFDFPFNLIKINSIILKYNNSKFIQKEDANLTLPNLTNINELFSSKVINFGNKLNLGPIFFNKDNDDIALHIYFLQACSNMRAFNFNIEPADYNQIFSKASKIIAAVSTSTSSVAGFLCLQIYSLMQSNDINHLKNSIMNLSSKKLFIYELYPPDFIEYNIESLNNKFTIWDKIIIKDKKTCEELITYIKENYDIDVNYIAIDGIIIIHLRKTKNPRVIENNNNNLKRNIEDIYYQKKRIFLKINENEKIKRDKCLFLQILGKYNNKNINSFPLIKYLIN